MVEDVIVASDSLAPLTAAKTIGSWQPWKYLAVVMNTVVVSSFKRVCPHPPVPRAQGEQGLSYRSRQEFHLHYGLILDLDLTSSPVATPL